jgi:hypothetical protein
MKKLSLFLLALIVSISMFASVNPVVKFSIDKGKLAKAKKIASKKDGAANNVLKVQSFNTSECPDVFNLIVDYDVTGEIELFPCDDGIHFRGEITFDDLYFLYATLYNPICMVEFDGLLAAWVDHVVSGYGECPGIE